MEDYREAVHECMEDYIRVERSRSGKEPFVWQRSFPHGASADDEHAECREPCAYWRGCGTILHTSL